MPTVLGFTLLLIKDLIVKKHGKNIWDNIIEITNIRDDFVTNKQYDILVFNKIVKICCEKLSVGVDDFLEIVGYWFYFYANSKGYRPMIRLGGKTLSELIGNLNKIHANVHEIFHTKTPSIWPSDITDNSLIIHYVPSDPSRIKWTPFLRGIIMSLAEHKYKLKHIAIKIIEKAADGAPHDKLLVTWINSNSLPHTSSDSSISSNPKSFIRSDSKNFTRSDSRFFTRSDSNSSSSSSLYCPFSGEIVSVDNKSRTFSVDSEISPSFGDKIIEFTPEYELSHEMLMKAFPFHIVFNNKFEILQMGNSLMKLLPLIRYGDLASEIFNIVNPTKLEWIFKDFMKSVGKPLVLSFQFDDIKRVNLFGEILFSHKYDAIYYLCSIDINSVQEACYLGLAISDFADHDSRKEIMFKTTVQQSLVDEENKDNKVNPKNNRIKNNIFKKLFAWNDSSLIKSCNNINEIDFFTQSVIDKIQNIDSLANKDIQLNSLERKEILALFSTKNSNFTNENKIIAGRSLCKLIQYSPSIRPQLVNEIVELDLIADLINFIDKYIDCEVHTHIHKHTLEILEIIGTGSAGNVHKARYFLPNDDFSHSPISSPCSTPSSTPTTPSSAPSTPSSAPTTPSYIFAPPPPFESISLLDRQRDFLYVAIKTINCPTSTDVDKVDFKRELSIMTLFQHPNLLHAIGGCNPFGHDEGIIIMPLLPTTLYAKLHDHSNKLNWSQKYIIAKGIADGMKYLHQLGIIHRDLKSTNCLLTESFHPILSDFGLSKPVSKNMTKAVGTIVWMAPEVLCGKPYDFTADVYSYGIILWELLTNSEPYADMDMAHVFDHIRKGGRPVLPSNPSNTQKIVIRIIRKCWHSIPSKRGSFSDILESLKDLEREVC